MDREKWSLAEQLEGEAAEDDAHGDEWGKRVGSSA